jgi:hypothetical protein
MTFDLRGVESLRTVRLGRVQVLQVVHVCLDDSVFIAIPGLTDFLCLFIRLSCHGDAVY